MWIGGGVVVVYVNVVAVETDACASELRGREWMEWEVPVGEVGVWWGKSERFYGGVVRAEDHQMIVLGIFVGKVHVLSRSDGYVTEALLGVVCLSLLEARVHPYACLPSFSCCPCRMQPLPGDFYPGCRGL